MIESCTDDFTVVWSDPAHAQLTWTWDKMHNPRPVPPLTVDVVTRMNADVFSARTVALNGYPYWAGVTFPSPTPEVLERGALDVWENEYMPRVRETCVRWRTADYRRMSAAGLADSLDELFKEAAVAFRYTMVVLTFVGRTNELANFCEAELGPDGVQLAATLLQGFENASAAAGGGLGDLAEAASSLPQVADALRAGRHGDLDKLTGGPGFLSELRRYLDEYGWRAESWALSHVPTWAEDPTVPLTLIGRYLSDGNTSPAAAIEKAIEQRREARREIESRLDADKLDRFQTMFDACQDHVRISEGRARWQLTITGSLRGPFLALGRKLAESTVLEEPNDVFFLSAKELREAARHPSRSWREAVQTRKADLERWERLTPPPFVGAPPSEDGLPAEFRRIFERFWGGGLTPSTEENVIKGHAASRGVARGPARIIRELSDAGRLQKGDILVCPSTAPPWTPLFAIAAAVVTDTGGILSHSAICAREFGIPSVVGTESGTQQIPDGALVTVDGGEGLVRIES